MHRRHLLLLAFVSGCYFYYPELPKTKPTLVDGAEIELHTHDKTDRSSCPKTATDCVVHDGSMVEEDHYQVLTATYDGKKLSQAEFRALADPEYPTKLEQIKSKKAACNVSLIPSVVAVLGIIGETIVLAAADQFGDKALPLALVTGGVGAAGAALSYPLGGYACRQAREIYDTMKLDYGDEVYVRPGDTIGDEMKTLADSFNARFGGHTPPPSDEPEPSTDSSLRVTPRGHYSTFLGLLDTAR